MSLSSGSGLLMLYSLQQIPGLPELRELKPCGENNNEGAGLPKAPTPSSCVATVPCRDNPTGGPLSPV